MNRPALAHGFATRSTWRIRRLAADYKSALRLKAGLMVLTVCGACAVWTWADDPLIDRIERLGSNQVTIHFYTGANRTYHLQSRVVDDTEGAWTNLFTVPAFPLENHYVVPDWVTGSGRVYRLVVE